MYIMASKLSESKRKYCCNEFVVLLLRPLLCVSHSDSLLDECSLLSGADFVVFPGSHVQLG